MWPLPVNAVFVELPAFTRYRSRYLDEMTFLDLQQLLMINPEAGLPIPGTGGLRKLRFADTRRQKGKRGGIRVIYFWWKNGGQFWLFTLYGKGELSDLLSNEKKALKHQLKTELRIRKKRS
jgi:hypothetical protein